jgi:hypothetical protein
MKSIASESCGSHPLQANVRQRTQTVFIPSQLALRKVPQHDGLCGPAITLLYFIFTIEQELLEGEFRAFELSGLVIAPVNVVSLGIVVEENVTDIEKYPTNHFSL